MNINIKKANKKDLSILLNFGYKLFETEKKFEPLLTFSSKKAKEKYIKELENKSSLFLIVELDKKPIGYLYAHAEKIEYFETNKKECEIEVIYLEPEYRGMGISQQLIEKCIIWSRKNNVFRIKAGIYEGNDNSKKAFNKFGFSRYHSTFTLTI